MYLYFAVRRGGRFLYALDVTDPATPKFLWRKTNASTGYEHFVNFAYQNLLRRGLRGQVEPHRTHAPASRTP